MQIIENMSRISDRLSAVKQSLQSFDKPQIRSAAESHESLEDTSSEVESQIQDEPITKRTASSLVHPLVPAAVNTIPASSAATVTKKSSWVVWVVVIVIILLVVFGIILYTHYKKRKQAANDPNKKKEISSFHHIDDAVAQTRPIHSSVQPRVVAPTDPDIIPI